MADDRTILTELATALGLTGYTSLEEAVKARPDLLKIESDEWERLRSVHRAGDWASIAETAFQNGRYFSTHADGFNGRIPQRIDWSGGRRIPGDRLVPADLLVDRVYMISCKYLSKVVLNTAPACVFLDGLAVTSRSRRINWFDEVASGAHQALYSRTVEVLGLQDMAASPIALNSEQRQKLKDAFKERTTPGLPDELGTEYKALIDDVSRASADRWNEILDDRAEQERMLWRLLRIYSATYFILGIDERRIMRLRVITPWEWRQSYKFVSFDVVAAQRGQPRVDWAAEYRDLAWGQRRRVRGHVEIRWGHRPFCGPPEAKVYLDTSHEEVPGYIDLDGRPDAPVYEQQRLINANS